MKKRNKAAQITLIILVGVVLLIGLGFIFYLKDISIEKKLSNTKIQELSVQYDPVKVYVDECVKIVTRNGANLLGVQGGYYKLPEYSINNTAYFYYLGENLFPSKEAVQNELASYVNNNLPDCTNDFKVFKNQGIEVTEGEVKTSIDIKDEIIEQMSYVREWGSKFIISIPKLEIIS